MQCPTGNHATYGQCDTAQDVCCFGAYDVTTPRPTTSQPAATTLSGAAPKHYLCHDVYRGTCLIDATACPSGNHATAYDVTTPRPTTSKPAATTLSGAAPKHYLCHDVYGGTCLIDATACPSSNHGTYGQCDGGQVCCFGSKPINPTVQTTKATTQPTAPPTTAKPATTVQSGSAPQHYLCQDVYGGTCLTNLMSCPTGNHATYGQCDGGKVCCFG
ncbi:hypothetical protein EGW08_011853 [Elysia chlorotica]|uniref:Uncharacterized protein n=1 Tax=Elysia chlorotica TaxID=188477 RepID=A0A3S1BGS1_ELYCH|nr:hypothetical protein EGW08_011853 [Elysia chlorotica]